MDVSHALPLREERPVQQLDELRLHHKLLELEVIKNEVGVQ